MTKAELQTAFTLKDLDILRRDKAMEAAVLGVTSPAPCVDMQVNTTRLLPPLVMSSDDDSATAAQHVISVEAPLKHSSDPHKLVIPMFL
ncbi:hypothetical protein SDRG_07243 [Saprolegnia diclina VS20]|uniref:Uncharacterized protein n=1 Tax=Saprolegnia diclina (strain VS20) TaxID=1156394 RepID=T0QJY0_SAPDV|nr:hypothetical protein SDRG_07243 [Saprolegnia diclina VS20]EQC35001.1 hypothetical protein SDRG_07243 [Saprolegnia diclina VS20]|eukprot:XP_008611285.1 hypothetical protein SDRG_07243 [Saprolegnia diclina VS20]